MPSFSARRALLLLLGLLLLVPWSGWTAEQPLNILATTFPVYQITRNIVAQVPGVKVDLMIPAQMGCPHDYALTPQDMRKLSRADLLVINGLGLEEFLGPELFKTHPRLRLIDSSEGVQGLLPLAKPERKGQRGDHEAHHHEGDINPHLFASPRMAGQMAAVIAAQLAALHPEGAAMYAANAQALRERLDRLAEECAALGPRLTNNRIVTQHEVLDYLARDLGLTIAAVVQARAGHDPSVSEIRGLVARVKANKAGALFTEPQYPQVMARMIAREAGIPAATLDPVANGPDQAPLDYYEETMRANLRTLEQILGRR